MKFLLSNLQIFLRCYTTVFFLSERKLSTSLSPLEILRAMAARKRGDYVPETPRHIKIKRMKTESGLEIHPSPLISLLTISNGFQKTPKSVVIRTDHRHYLFGCGEGTQRILMELSTKYLKINQILLTNSTWEQTGGLIGLSINLESSASDEFTLHAPFEVKSYLERSRTAEAYKFMRLLQHRYDLNPKYKDETLIIQQIKLPLKSKSSLKPSQDSIANDGYDNAASYCCYIVDSQQLPPRLVNEKCVLYGVPPNHLRRELKNGRSVTLEDGRVVNPDDVVIPGHPQVRILFVDINTDDIAEHLDFVFDNLSDRLPDYVVHFTPSVIQQSLVYRQKITNLFAESRHLLLDECYPNVESGGIYKMQCRLNSVNKDFFPLFPCQQQYIMDKDKRELTENANSKDVGSKSRTDAVNIDNDESLFDTVKANYPFESGYDQALFAKTGLNVSIRNNNFELMDGFLLMHTTDHTVDTDSGTVDQQVTSKKNDYIAANEQKPTSYPYILFLGTGACCPSKVRNVSSILLQTSADSTVLLDCGEGTVGQLYRFFGDKARDVIKNINIIFISHMHPDHHQGLFGIIQEWHRAHPDGGRNLQITCPSNLISILKNSINVFNLSRYVDVIDYCVDTIAGKQTNEVQSRNVITLFRNRMLSSNNSQHCSDSSSSKQCKSFVSNGINLNEVVYLPDYFYQKYGLSQYTTVLVEHIYDSHALVISHKDNWKVVYSGDCRPSKELARIGKDADILIHEATLEDGMEEEAKVVNHCTFSESAIQQGSIFELPLHQISELANITQPLKSAFSSEFDLLEQKRIKAVLLKKQLQPQTNYQHQSTANLDFVSK
ncbi:hypothetical protein GJ496_009657 [Pomphorhynchus laevis]|nr:hypothetical protein GJ496_009657 [Pomphorhynchus laevis]